MLKNLHLQSIALLQKIVALPKIRLICSRILILGMVLCCATFAQAQPAGFSDQLFMGNWTNVVGMTFDDNGRIYVYEKAGKVWIVDNGVKLPNPLIDISEEVGDWRDFGFLGFVLDPNFLTNGYIYMQYTVDRHHLLYFGTNNYNPNTNEYFSATIGRITRYTARPETGYTSVDYSSRKVLLGETKETGVPSLHESHGIGGLVFGTDGTLLACAGDGASYGSVDQGSASETYYSQALADGIIRSDENVGAYRCQKLDSHNGKILRIDPATGNGVPSNPFYNGASPRSAQSRVWARGVRNPYRICKQPNTGSHFEGDGDPGVFYFGDVGWGNREELNIIPSGGLNFGWPKYEGMTYQPGYNNATYAPTTHERPKVDWRNGSPRALVNGTIYNVGSAQVPGPTFNGNASTGGVFYQGHDFPGEYHDTYFHADYGADWIRHFSFDANRNPTEVKNFISNGGPIVFLASDHNFDGLFYVRYPSQIRRVVYTGSNNQEPIAKIMANTTYGSGPLSVQFSGDESFDPEFQSLTYAWNFGDGSSSSSANPNHTFNSGNNNPASYTVTLTVTDPQGNTGQTTQVISLNNTPPIIVSTSIDNTNSFSYNNSSNLSLNAVVTDAEHSAGQLTWEWTTSLFHNDHHHDEPVDNNASTSTTLSPIGCDGATYWYRITLKVTDAAGLSTTFFKDLYPNCPGTNQSITFSALADRLTNAPPFSVNASASSGLAVSIYVSEGPASITNGTLTLQGIPGTVVLRAIQSGNGTYSPALPVEQSFEVLTSPPPNCIATGTISQETWTGITGTAVTDIPINTTPDAMSEINIFEIPVNTAEEYGVRLRGYFCAPQTGNYTFWISSDDNGELWLSSGESPANKSLIASVPDWTNSREWDKFPEQQSALIYLVEGQKYYIEALMKEAFGGDNLAVGWQLPNGTLERPIPGSYLSPWDSTPPNALKAEVAIASNVSSNWQSITLDNTYASPVVVATVKLDNGSALPAVARVRNASGNSFELKVQNPSDQNLSAYSVHYVVVEEGVYTQADHGIKMEAQTQNSSLTAELNNWLREPRVYQNTYSNPVVLGQVMSANDADWSSFWASTTASEFDPPNTNSFAAGKHVAEDTDKTRLDETIGYIIVEQGNGTLDGTPFYAALGTDIVGGVDGQTTGYSYAHSGLTNANIAVLTSVGMDGNNGGWPVLFGTNPLSNTDIKVAVDEDQIADAERAHTTEQFTYIVFDNGTPGPQNQTITFNNLADKLTTDLPFTISGTASSGLPVSFTLISGPATISGNTVSLTGAEGNVTIRASQAGNSDYNAAANVDRSFNVTTLGGPVDYCASRGTQPWVEWIERVTFESIDNSSFKDSYGDYTNLSTDVNQGANYTIDLDPGLSWSGHLTDLFWRVWIDFNQDGDFNDSGEKVVEANNGSAAVSATISIPSTATLGLTRMRVSMKKDVYPGPCEVFDFGEVEDYSVNILDGTGGPTCENVTSGGTISGDEAACDGYDPGTINTATTPSGGSGNLEYQWQQSTGSATGPWTNAGGSSASFDPGPITQTTWYRRRARRSNCSAYAGISNVVTKTVENCPPPGTYCNSIGTQPWFEWIDRVTFGTIDNTTFKDLYGDYTNLVTDAEQGSTMPIDLNPGLTWSGYQTDLFWRVWIDFNGDGDFMDSGEMVVEANNGRDAVSSSISIPTTATVGTTRMRVSMQRDQYPTSCASFNFGEVEDYSINITPMQTSSPFLAQQVLSLEVHREQMGAALEWMTNTGYKNDYYLIERSDNGVDYHLLDVVDNEYQGTAPYSYVYFDDQPLMGPNYYQVKQVYQDGTFRYTEEKLLIFNTGDNRLIVFPNPAFEDLNLSVQSYRGKPAQIRIYNALGQLMEERAVQAISNYPESFLLEKYTNGIYTISVKVEGHKLLSTQFIVNKTN